MARNAHSRSLRGVIPISAGLFLLAQSLFRLSSTFPGTIEPWLVTTVLGGLGTTLVGIDLLSHGSGTESGAAMSDVTCLVPYGITVLSLLVGVSVFFA